MARAGAAKHRQPGAARAARPGFAWAVYYCRMMACWRKRLSGRNTVLEKEYLVEVAGKITDGRLTLLRSGLRLDERRLETRQGDAGRGAGPTLRSERRA